MTDERELLRETVAALVAKHASPEAVREAMESERGYDESLWRLLCEQVGASALVVPEEYGGAGGGFADTAVVIEELGKRLVPTPCWAPHWPNWPCLPPTIPTPTSLSGSPRARPSARWCSTLIS